MPQLAQFEATSSSGGPVVDHRAPLMMKAPAEPQFAQATLLPIIARRKHPAFSPETITAA